MFVWNFEEVCDIKNCDSYKIKNTSKFLITIKPHCDYLHYVDVALTSTVKVKVARERNTVESPYQSVEE